MLQPPRKYKEGHEQVQSVTGIPHNSQQGVISRDG